jgi:hypothetical protein
MNFSITCKVSDNSQQFTPIFWGAGGGVYRVRMEIRSGNLSNLPKSVCVPTATCHVLRPLVLLLYCTGSDAPRSGTSIVARLATASNETNAHLTIFSRARARVWGDPKLKRNKFMD